MKNTKKIISVVLSLLLVCSSFTLWAAAAGMGGPGGGGTSSPTYSGATTINSSVNKSGTKYTSSSGGQNALLASSGNSTLSNITVSKTGDASDENADFYGTNAAVLAYNSATLNISDSTITTSSAHANAVFAYSGGTINISDSTIKTTGNNSGAVMVTGGGALTADNVTATTDGNSSAPIRSDRGGGTLTVNGGAYTANGVGSPAIYSTADITVNNATLVSTSSEGVVVEGANSVTLNNTSLTDTNNSLNGNSETYKNIFLYQSMSGDADEGNASFTAKNSTLTTNKGDTIFVTNTTAAINLENNEIVNNDSTGIFLRIQAGKWGNSGSNGGNVTLNASNQIIDGDIYADSISTLAMSLKNSSTYTGAINSENTAKSITLALDSSSTLVLTGDTYVSSLENELSDNSNINLNGYTLYVGGKAITKTAYKADTDTQSEMDTEEITESVEPAQSDESNLNMVVIIVILAAAAVAIVAAVVIIKARENKKKKDDFNNINLQ